MATRNLRVLRQHRPLHHQLLRALLPVRQECRGHWRVMLHMRAGLHNPYCQHHRCPQDPRKDQGAARHCWLHLQRSADDLLLHAVCSCAGSTRGSDARGPIYVQGIDSPVLDLYDLHTVYIQYFYNMSTICLQHVYNITTTLYQLFFTLIHILLSGARLLHEWIQNSVLFGNGCSMSYEIKFCLYFILKKKSKYIYF